MSMKCVLQGLKHKQSYVCKEKQHCRHILWGLYILTLLPNSASFHITIYLFGWQYLSDWWTTGHGKTEVVNATRSRERASHFHLSPSITLKDVCSQHGRVRRFTQEPPVVEVSLDLQEDKISAEERTENLVRQACLWEYWWYSLAHVSTKRKERRGGTAK